MVICGHLGQMKNLAALARCPLLRGKFNMVRLIRMVQSLIPQLAAVYIHHMRVSIILGQPEEPEIGGIGRRLEESHSPFYCVCVVFFVFFFGGGGMEKVIYNHQRMPFI